MLQRHLIWGAAAYVHKPLFLEQMLEVLESLIRPTLVPSDSLAQSREASSGRQIPTLLQLHERIVSGEASALDQLARRLWTELPRRLRHRFRVAQSDAIVDAVEDAIVEYAAHPSRFDPSRGLEIGQFLAMAARRNLLNALKADAARRAREAKYASQQSTTAYPDHVETAVHSDLVVRALLLGAARDETERCAVLTWLAGDCTTEGIANSLGLSKLPPLEKRREVKRFKDRILKRLAPTNHRQSKV